jgi:membrane-associated protease RseP (regulator of RpoE activity)
MGTVAYALLFALIIMVSVCLHEAGHMITAKSFGMKVTRYFAGFGPTIFSFKRGETEYGLKAIPLGGFVKIVGMTPQEDDVAPEDEPRAMWRQPVWKRTIVMSAGSITHFILGFVLLWITASFVGLPNPNLTLDKLPASVSVQSCVPKSATAVECTPNTAGALPSPAQAAGLRDGDVVTSFNGTPTPHYQDLQKAIRAAAPGATVPVAFTRDGVAQTPVQVALANVPRSPLDNPDGPTQPTAAFGIGLTVPPNIPPNVTYGPVDGIGQAVSYTGTTAKGIGSAITNLPSKVPGLVRALSGEPRDPNGPISVVGASELGGQAASLGLWNVVLLLAATLNFFVGVFNLLPLLPLDGGHIAIAWYEKVRSWFARKRNKPDPGRVDYLKLMPVTYAVFIVFAGFSALTILADIINPVNLFGK